MSTFPLDPPVNPVGLPYGGRFPFSEVEPKEGDNIPDDIQSFMEENGIAGKFYATLKEYPPESGTPHLMKKYLGNVPTINEIGKAYGPGEYGLVFFYKDKDGGKQSKETRFALPERAWKFIHETYIREQQIAHRKKLKESIQTEKLNAELDAIQDGKAEGAGAQPDSLEVLQKYSGILRGLGIPIGQAGGEKTDYVPLIAALAPLAVKLFEVATPRGDSGNGMMQAILSMQAESQKNMITLFTAMMAMNQNGGGQKYMEQIMNMAFSAMGSVAQFNKMLTPQEKPAMIDRIFEFITSAIPQIMELSKMSKAEKEGSFIYKAAQATPEYKAAISDPEVQISICQRLDKKYGFQATNGILEGMGFERHPSTAENFKLYPSKGYDFDGNKIEGNRE